MSSDIRPMVSMVADATSTETTHASIDSLRGAIKHGRWKPQIEEIRCRYQEAFRKTRDHKEAKRTVDVLKKKLPGALWSGCFNRRDNKSLERHSGFVCLDIDELDSKKDEVRQKLSSSPYLYFLHESPTGRGVKAIFSVVPDARKHEGSFRALKAHVRELAGVDVDEAAKDLARLSFISWDPFAFYNPKPRQIEPLPEPEKPPRPSNPAVNLSARQRIAEELLGTIDWLSETSGLVVCPGKHLHTAGEGERDCKIDFDKVPTVHCFHNHCRGILDGINKELRSRIGKAEFKPEGGAKSVLSALSHTITTLNEHKTLKTHSQDVPLPLGQAAFNGLAGRFAKRVEPDTEGDPAALLVQFLVAFGNTVGRRPHAKAEATRHGMNLFVATVGKTSKARKGTTWDHVKRVFWHTDRSWTENNITGGLSSGEGLIHSVRDPVSKFVKGELEVVDEGISDKRELVFQGEFSGVLKVMDREGNTLSSVLRDAWDGVKLSTLSKHSGETATNTHISIAAHITREEVRKQLTETESANGFGNRFLWLLVKRSKHLPEGGMTPGIADIVTDLEASLEFARNTDLITRKEAARDLWAEVYPKLSEGLPGLVGALTARAEAQVLRISCIYALLDCSPVVDVPHLKAALEVWRYCEDSAKLIFETGTGDRNADRILRALSAVGEKGITKTEMRGDIFNNHISAFDLDEALRLLHGLALAQCRQENTAGRPVERWFATKT